MRACLANGAGINEKGCVGDAIENEDEPLLGRLGHGIDDFAIAPDTEQRGGRGKIAIPDVVLDRLEMPEPLAGLCIEREKGVRKKIVPGTVGAVEIG